MHQFPCTPDCPLEIWADWLEDHGVDPGEIRLLAQGLVFFGFGDRHSLFFGCGLLYDFGYGYCLAYGNGKDFDYDYGYAGRFGNGYGCLYENH